MTFLHKFVVLNAGSRIYNLYTAAGHPNTASLLRCPVARRKSIYDHVFMRDPCLPSKVIDYPSMYVNPDTKMASGIFILFQLKESLLFSIFIFGE